MRTNILKYIHSDDFVKDVALLYSIYFKKHKKSNFKMNDE